MDETPQQVPVAGETVDLSKVVQPALAASANPAADMAAAVLARSAFGLPGQPRPQDQPPPAPAPQPPPAPAPQPPPQETPASLSDRYSAPDPDAKPVVPELAAVPPEQDIRLPDTTPENVGRAFAAARAETKQYKQLAEDYRAQVEKVRADYDAYAQKESALAEQLTAAQNRANELEEQLGKLDLSKAPSFRQKYDEPILAVQDQIAATLVDNGYQADAAAELAGQVVSSGSLDEVQSIPDFARLPATVQGMVMYKYNEANNLWAQRDQALSDWRSTQTGLEQVDAREGAVQSAQRRSDLVSTGIDRVSRIVPPAIWGDADFAKYRDANAEKVKAWYGQATDDQIATAAVEGSLVTPYLYGLVNQLSGEILRLRDQIDAGSRVRSPQVVPYHKSVPVVAPPAPPPNQEQRRSWAAVEPTTDPVMAASNIVGSVLRGRM